MHTTAALYLSLARFLRTASWVIWHAEHSNDQQVNERGRSPLPATRRLESRVSDAALRACPLSLPSSNNEKKRKNIAVNQQQSRLQPVVTN
jgi:hypothetical protein